MSAYSGIGQKRYPKIETYNLVYVKFKTFDIYNTNDTPDWTRWSKPYLFSAPKNENFIKGDRVYVTCENRKGDQLAVVVAPNFVVSEYAAEIILDVAGGYFPPAKVVGREITTKKMFDVPMPV